MSILDQVPARVLKGLRLMLAACGELPWKDATNASLVKEAGGWIERAGVDPPHYPTNCVEFVNEDGRRYAWSESNVTYELVADAAGNKASFTVMRNRHDKLQLAAAKMIDLLDADVQRDVQEWCDAVEEVRVLLPRFAVREIKPGG